MKHRIKVVIPARLASTRLPRKPLVDIAGKPMVLRTFERCAEALPARDILVATDSNEIGAICDLHGMDWILTRDDHLTGTDRVAEVAGRVDADILLNVQGDEPLFNPDDIHSLIDYCDANPSVIANGYCPISDAEEHASPMTPKVVFDLQGKLLYMSRSPIPGSKSGGFRFGYRQVCAYGFPAAVLKDFADHPAKTPLEESEDVEILRFLELGHQIQMLPMSSQSIPVDMPEDVDKVVAALTARGID